jgi:ribosome-associated protein
MEEVERRMKERYRRGPRRREGTKDTGWMILDYGDVVVHGFTGEQREFYDLERLWADAPQLPFEDEAQARSAQVADGQAAARGEGES